MGTRRIARAVSTPLSLRAGVLVALLLASACTIDQTGGERGSEPTGPASTAASPSSVDALTLHIDQPPSQGVDGGQEVIPLVQEKACPSDTDQDGYSFGFRTRDRSSSSWTVIATCDDHSKHTVVVVWD